MKINPPRPPSLCQGHREGHKRAMGEDPTLAHPRWAPAFHSPALGLSGMKISADFPGGH